MFLGRERELQFLTGKYLSHKAEIIVLYGRRRVGKTELLREFCRDKHALFYSCTECTDEQQLSSFSRTILKNNTEAGKYITKFADWDSAFGALTDLQGSDDGKQVVVIDEFPYMCKGNSSIPSIIQNLWDSKLKDSNIFLVLCGSSMSFMEKELLAEKNPLYGRATGIYKLKEMEFNEVVQFFPNYSPEDLVRTYAILGGIPHYLLQFDSQKSLEWNIKNNILRRGCALYNEVEFMMHQELRETNVYNAILENIASGSTKLGEISDKSLLYNTAKTSVYLKNLQELALVEKVYSAGEEQKKRANQNKGIYHISDSFFRFWYAFVFPNFSLLEQGNADSVYKYIVEPQMQKFCAGVYERVCQFYLQTLNKCEKLNSFYKELSNWWGKAKVRQIENGTEIIRTVETEIDILGISFDKKKYLVGECKFMNRPFRYSEYVDTKNKVVELQESADIEYYMFSMSGFEQELYEIECENLHLVNVDEIIKFFASQTQE